MTMLRRTEGRACAAGPALPSWAVVAQRRFLSGFRRSLLVALPALLAAGPLGAQPAGPARNRVFGLQHDGFARLPVPDEPGLDWRVETLKGARVVRDFAPAEPGGVLRLPAGGWYRLLRREPGGEARQVGNRFAAGYLVIVTGQSQADSFFFDGAPSYGAYPAEAGDPEAPACMRCFMIAWDSLIAGRMARAGARRG
jgi:hypothetical protein